MMIVSDAVLELSYCRCVVGVRCTAIIHTNK
jgi:hypothetical protein